MRRKRGEREGRGVMGRVKTGRNASIRVGEGRAGESREGRGKGEEGRARMRVTRGEKEVKDEDVRGRVRKQG